VRYTVTERLSDSVVLAEHVGAVPDFTALVQDARRPTGPAELAQLQAELDGLVPIATARNEGTACTLSGPPARRQPSRSSQLFARTCGSGSNVRGTSHALASRQPSNHITVE
jgi:hypothetical protein